MSQTIVDDDDAAVRYQPSWHPDPGAWNMVDRSRHGTPDQGAQASLTFTGTGIEVFGTVQSSASDGYPTTTYAIDGQPMGTYTPPFVNNGDQLFNVSFFAKQDLTSGEHTIVITNTNGTSPNYFWLDYFLIDSGPGIPDVLQSTTTLHPISTSTRTMSSTSDSPSPMPPRTSSTTTHTSSVSSDPSSLPVSTVSETSTSSVVTTFNGTSISQPTTTSSQSTTTSSQSTTSSFPRFSNASSSSISATTSISVLPTSSEAEVRAPPGDLNLAAILGGVFGALALLVLLLLSCIWRKRRRHKVVQVATIERERSFISHAADSDGDKAATISITSHPFGHMRTPSDVIPIMPSESYPSAASRAPPLSTRASSLLSTSMRSDIASDRATTSDSSDGYPFPSIAGPSWRSPRAAGRNLALEKLQEHLYGSTVTWLSGARSNQTGIA